MFSAVTVPAHRTQNNDLSDDCPMNHGDFIEHNRCVSDGLSDETGALSQILAPEAQRKGTTGRLLQFLRLLDGDPSVALTIDVDQLTVTVPRRTLRLRQLAIRCGVSSPSTAGEWLRKWRDTGLLDHNSPTIYLAGLIAEGQHSQSAGAALSSSRSEEAHSDLPALDLLLTHLARAHEHGPESLIDHLGSLIESELSRSRGSTTEHRAGRAVTQPRVSSRDTERSEVVSSLPTVEKLTNSTPLLREEPTAQQPRESDKPRNRAEIETLLQPLLERCRDLGLPSMTQWQGVENALRGFDDNQIHYAQRVIKRQMNAAGAVPISSPIGLLVTQARAANPDYFNAPTPVSTFIEPPSEPVEDQPRWEQSKAAVAKIKANTNLRETNP